MDVSPNAIAKALRLRKRFRGVNGKERISIAGDPFTPALIGPSAGHWERGPGKYGRVAFFTSDGGTASPPEGGAQPAKLVKIELFAETAAT